MLACAAVGSAPPPAPVPPHSSDDGPVRVPLHAIFERVNVNDEEEGDNGLYPATGAIGAEAPQSTPEVGDIVLGKVLCKEFDGGAKIEVLSAGFGEARICHASVSADISAMAVGSVNRFEVISVDGTGGRVPELRAATYKSMMQCHRAQQLLDSEAYVDMEIRKVTKASLVGELEGLTAFIPRGERVNMPMKPKTAGDDYYVGKVYRVLISKVVRSHVHIAF